MFNDRRPKCAATQAAAVRREGRLLAGSSSRTASTTLSDGASAGIWYTMARPASRASAGRMRSNSRPARPMVPESGTTDPAAIPTRVDFPAPFSPSTACTRPAAMSTETASSAVTPG